MCKLVDELSIERVNGYKVAVLENGKYYSPTTGIEYREGYNVEIPTVQKNYVEQDIVSTLLQKGCWGYDDSMVGRTCVFINKDDALNLLRSFENYDNLNLVILKMNISKELMLGTYSCGIVIGGKFISYFREENLNLNKENYVL